MQSTTFQNIPPIFNTGFRLYLSLQGAMFPSSLSTKILHAFLFSSMRATCPVNLIYVDLITCITFGEQ